MKHKKFWKGVLSFLCFVIVATAINMGIKVAMEGMWLLGIPEPEAVSSVTIKHQYETEQIKEITDPEQVETCVHLTGFLKYRPFADPEVATGKASPRITFYYHLNSGDTVEVSANANTVFYNGKKHVLKDDDSFVNFVEGLFFNDSVLYGRISEIADGNLLIEADGKSYIIYDWMEYIPTGPSFEIGDKVEITHHGIAPEEKPAGLYGVSKIDLTHDAYIRKYGNESSDEPLWDYPPMVMVNGELYIDTGKKSTVDGRCGNMDGQITSSVPQTEMPTENNQSNFGTGFGYQYGPTEGTIEIYINDTWWVYATEKVRNK